MSYRSWRQYWVTDIWVSLPWGDNITGRENSESRGTEIEKCRKCLHCVWFGCTAESLGGKYRGEGGREAVDAWFAPPLSISRLECRSLERIFRICLESSLSSMIRTQPSTFAWCLSKEFCVKSFSSVKRYQIRSQWTIPGRKLSTPSSFQSCENKWYSPVSFLAYQVELGSPGKEKFGG